MEFTHVCHLDCQRYHHGLARVYRCLCWLYLPGSQTTTGLFVEEEGSVSSSNNRSTSRSGSVDKPVYKFVFLRHGESIGNAESRWQGQSDYALTEKGRKQA